MNKATFWSFTTARLLLGWYMLADGWLIITNPDFSAAGFLLSAKTFPTFYAWFATPMNLVWVNPLNAWSITLIGVALILGVGVRPAAWGAAVMHILYYFPHYVFPTVPHGFIVEDHIIYAAMFVMIALAPEAEYFGLGSYVRRTFLGRIPVVRALI